MIIEIESCYCDDFLDFDFAEGYVSHSDFSCGSGGDIDIIAATADLLFILRGF